MNTKDWDERRKIIIPGNKEETITFCVEHFIKCANDAIKDHGSFFVALSGGSTPKAMFELLSEKYADQVDWSKVQLFWSDERSVKPENPDSNFNMAMRSGFAKLPLPKDHIHRMVAEDNIEQNAKAYEKAIHQILGSYPFDLVMLGMGEDGHTASLFPGTEGLKENTRKVIANFIPEKETWRMTMTFPLINRAQNIAIYVLGEGKKERILSVLSEKDKTRLLPSARVGTKENPAVWIADTGASALISSSL
ncbi:6-phosphogluconolactonase [Candidatus Aerophobetes bacterium]|uniref:6-phosphogluconolactonase n=1 Tax=Aerophobetes bacterium TaxID=2030807 RepID=A0A2A4YD40_UNCAE|nr:MAG: 6-phosphogluconolactonase [Candidatus Aerophobetes bacterium]